MAATYGLVVLNSQGAVQIDTNKSYRFGWQLAAQGNVTTSAHTGTPILANTTNNFSYGNATVFMTMDADSIVVVRPRSTCNVYGYAQSTAGFYIATFPGVVVVDYYVFRRSDNLSGSDDYGLVVLAADGITKVYDSAYMSNRVRAVLTGAGASYTAYDDGFIKETPGVNLTYRPTYIERVESEATGVNAMEVERGLVANFNLDNVTLSEAVVRKTLIQGASPSAPVYYGGDATSLLVADVWREDLE